MADAATGAAGSAAAPPPAKLDELMLAMDVVDTLRHQEGLVEKELGQESRDETLKARLRLIYESQGLTVSDRILEEGIRALKESRFSYEPPPAGFSRTLALLWVRRGAVARMVLLLAVLGGAYVGYTAWQSGSAERAETARQVEITETLPAQLKAAADAAVAEARDTRARTAAEDLSRQGEQALARGDADGARKAIGGLDDLRARLVETYELRIVSRPGEQSGVFRIPDVNESARNYYVIVEAVTPSGTTLSLPVVSEEDGKTATVSKWAVRVSEATFNKVRKDKAADGIVNDAVVAEKPRGSLDLVQIMPTLGGAITSW